jgi:hypothetical protein
MRLSDIPTKRPLIRWSINCVLLVAAILFARLAYSLENPLRIEFVPLSDHFHQASVEYQQIWEQEKDRIVAEMERRTGLKFPRIAIQAIVYEGISSSGYGSAPMRLRASLDLESKRGTLVHELGHRLLGNIHRGNQHPVLFLFLYDVWKDLWGEAFADRQVRIESQRRGLYDYAGAWKAALSLSADERAALLRSILGGPIELKDERAAILRSILGGQIELKSAAGA